MATKHKTSDFTAARRVGGAAERAALTVLRRAAREAGGELIGLARAVGVSHRTLCRWLLTWEGFAAAVRAERERRQ